MGFVGWVMHPLISLLDFPAIPAGVDSLFQTVFGYMRSGMVIINWVCPINLIQPAIDVFLAVFIIEHSYRIVMWVLRKIPMFGIS